MFIDLKSLQYVFSQKDMNLRQRGQLELFKDYDMNFLYHHEKAKIIDDALSRLPVGSVAHVQDEKKQFISDVYGLAQLGVQLVDSTEGCVMVYNGSE